MAKDFDDLNSEFYRARDLHKAGDVDAAARIYQQLLPDLPYHAELLYLMGAAFVHLDRAREAIPVLERALAIKSDHSPTIEMLGSAWVKLRDPKRALPYFQDAFRTNPKSIEVACRLGTTLIKTEQYAKAVGVFEHALSINSQHPEAISGKAFAQKKCGMYEKAEIGLRRCINVNPTYAQGYTILGSLLVDLEKYLEAEQVLRHGISTCPNHPDILHDLAIVFHRQGKLKDAVQAYKGAIECGMSGPDIAMKLGDALTELERLQEADTLISEALKLTPQHAGLLTGLGRIEEIRGNLETALKLHDRAIAADESYADTYINRGNARRFSGDFTGALADYDTALSLAPTLLAATANRGITLLTLERFDEGWPAFKTRVKARAGSINLSGTKNWDGTPLDGKRVLVWTEYGLGDEILFAGLLPELISKTAQCTLVCSSRLVTLFRRAFPTATVCALGESIEGEFDARFPLTDAAQWLRPNLGSFPKHSGYMRATPDLTERLRAGYKANDTAPLVGISWHSGGSLGTAPFKSIPLDKWSEILNTREFKFVSLQYGEHEAEINSFNKNVSGKILVDHEVSTSGDMDAFAAQVAAMDLVISVSNTTVHFAGSLGKPVWAMIPKGQGAHWYWFQDREDSVWYPSLNLYRQKKPGDWSEPLEGVRANLLNWQPT